MRISSSSNLTTLYTPKSTQKDSLSFTQEKAHAKTRAQNSKIDIYEQIAQDYDICNASHKELCEISRKLYKQGEISGLDCAILTFNPELSPAEIFGEKYNYFLTEADQNGKRNWIIEFEARVKQDKSIGNTQGCILHQKLVDVLMRLQRK